MTRVLVITGDPIGPKMAGPAIRAWNMAQLLAIDNEVALMTTTLLEPVDASFELHRVKPGEDAVFVGFAMHDPALDLGLDRVGIDHGAAIGGGEHLVHPDHP